MQVSRSNLFYDSLFQISNRSEAHLELNSLRRKTDCALIIKGDYLEVGMDISTEGTKKIKKHEN